uniref:Uncharacterized protein n=1 Tax=Timema tahoe TaxID=61484 RepID=A0A7R9IQG0_9NEOP|nr:unnamed protein product [Timema tahoe]
MNNISALISNGSLVSSPVEVVNVLCSIFAAIYSTVSYSNDFAVQKGNIEHHTIDFGQSWGEDYNFPFTIESLSLHRAERQIQLVSIIYGHGLRVVGFASPRPRQRSSTSTDYAREEIVLETKNKYLYCRECDLASQRSIRNFVKQFGKEQSNLDILINNAGVMRCPYTKTQDGIELQLGVNHIGHFLLTNLLLTKLQVSAPSRIINVSSVAHMRGKINTEDLNSENGYDAGEAYNQSKLANILFTRELARRLQGTRVTVNAVHPGIVDTELTRHMSFFNSTLSSLFLKPFVWLFIKSPRQGAQTTLYAALDENLEHKTGIYLR